MSEETAWPLSWLLPAKRATFDRRHYRRVQAPMLFRSGRRRDVPRHASVQAVGISVYSDERCRPGDILELELSSPAIVVTGRVRWCDKLPSGGAARYDIGIDLPQVSAETLAALTLVLV